MSEAEVEVVDAILDDDEKLQEEAPIQDEEAFDDNGNPLFEMKSCKRNPHWQFVRLVARKGSDMKWIKSKDATHAFCLLCRRNITFSAGNGNSVFRHVERNHQKKLDELLGRNKNDESSENNYDSDSESSNTPTIAHVSKHERIRSKRRADVAVDASKFQESTVVRTATAQTIIKFPQDVIDAFYDNINNSNHDDTSETSYNTYISNNELMCSKGPIFATAKIAGIMSAKRTCEIIPLCHTILLDTIDININLSVEAKTVTINCTCKTSSSRTGVEMEALVGSTVAALTIYDMTKSMSHNIVLSQTKIISNKSNSGSKRIRTA